VYTNPVWETKFWPSTATEKRYVPVCVFLGATQVSVVAFKKVAFVRPALPAPVQPNEQARLLTFTKPEPVTTTVVFPSAGPADGLMRVTLVDTNLKPVVAAPESVDCVVASPFNDTVTTELTEPEVNESRGVRDGVRQTAYSEVERIAVVAFTTPVAVSVPGLEPEYAMLKRHFGTELSGYLVWLNNPVPRRVISVFPSTGPADGKTEEMSTDCVK